MSIRTEEEDENKGPDGFQKNSIRTEEEDEGPDGFQKNSIRTVVVVLIDFPRSQWIHMVGIFLHFSPQKNPSLS